ncbi:cell division septal protein FtsQ [Elusimicrobium simillimum]|uniref:FtsQ-type POTRA domain-containing protein n=1 Tax=Elusimicrobium simillimum TaxID=3143438 RepID=UPI003C7017D4
MKNNLVYYSKPRRPVGKRRRTNKPNIVRPVIILTVFVAVALSFCYFIYKAVPRAKAKIAAFQVEGYSGWTYKTAQITGVDNTKQKDILAAINIQTGQRVSTEDAKALQKRLALKFPELKNVRVKRGLFSGKLRVSAAPRSINAILLGPSSSVRYVLDSEGVIYPVYGEENLSSYPTVLITAAGEGAAPVQKVSKEFVQLVNAVNALKKSIDFTTLVLDENGTNAKLLLADNSVIDFGAPTDLAKKAKTSSKILEYSKARVKAPYEINFEYFSNGKVYLKPLEVN